MLALLGLYTAMSLLICTGGHNFDDPFSARISRNADSFRVMQGVSQPLGLTEKRSVYVTQHSSSYDDIRWIAAERRTAELLSLIEPNIHSERQRKAVADYVKDLIHKCLDCQVFKFGSVPLKTYLPDGDIDLTTFSRHPNLKATWANDVQAVLKYEERRKDTRFCVREVQCIPAEVKIVKCLVEGIVVDISFNQLGGLSTLCFLEEVDRLIQKDHLFKRSIILVKAWCYYESRLLGAHHGLISTYALETLVLYIFNVFHATLRGPLEVLFTFMDYFSNFDWEKYCVSIWGPVPLASTSTSREPPLVSESGFLLSKGFLEACRTKYDVISKDHDLQARVFGEKFLNVLDPLQINNNLGRSVSKANYFRIRSAFSLGAHKLAKIFESSDEDLTMYLDDFFSNTWERHQSGARRDAPKSVFPPSQIFTCKGEDLHVLHDASIDDPSSAGEKTSDMRQSLHKIDSQDAWQISAEDTPLNSSVSCSKNYKEKTPTTDMNMHVKIQQNDFSSNGSNMTESLSMVKNQRQFSQYPLRRTVSEGRLERLSDMYSLGNMAVKPNNTKNLGKSATELVATNNYNGLARSKPVVKEATDHLQVWGNGIFQEGNSIDVGSKSPNEWQFDEFSRASIDTMSINNASHEERNEIPRFPFRQPTLRSHAQQSHTPYVYFPGYTSQPGTIMFSPFSAFGPPLHSGESNVGKVNGLIHRSSTVTAPIPFVSPPVPIQPTRVPVPSLLSYNFGAQSMASIPPLHINNLDSSKIPIHSQNINELEQLEKQEQLHPWNYAMASLASSQVLDFDIGNADGRSASNHRKGPQVEIQDSGGIVKGKGDIKGRKSCNFRDVPKAVLRESSEGVGTDSGIIISRNEFPESEANSCGESNLGKQSPPYGQLYSALAPGFEAYTPTPHPSYITSKSCVSDMDEFSSDPSSFEDSFSKITSLSDSDCPILEQENSNIVTVQKSIEHPEGFPSSSVEVPSPTDGTIMEAGLGNQGVLDTTPCFPMGTFPMFSYYNPFYPAKSDFDSGFDVEAMKGVSQYNELDHVHRLHGIGPEGSPLISKAYHGIGDMPNARDSGAAANFGPVSTAERAHESSADFLRSDLVNHLQDLEFGRSCQEPVIDPLAPNYMHNPFDWKVLPYIPIQKIPGFHQHPVPSNPMLAFGHMHMPNILPQQYACSLNDVQQQQTGTWTFFPSRPSLYNNNIQCLAERYPEAAPQYEHRNGANGGPLRHRNANRGCNGNASTQIPGAPHKVAEGKHGRNNTWRNSHHLTSGYSPISSGLVAPPFHGPYKEFPGFHVAGTFIHESEPVTRLSSHHLPGAIPPLVPQLEFGSLGPINCMILSGEDSTQPIRFSTSSDTFSSSSDREPVIDSLSR